VTPAERITRALARIPDSRIRNEIADAIEAMADAHEYIAAMRDAGFNDRQIALELHVSDRAIELAGANRK
jgi:hypothetical protein